MPIIVIRHDDDEVDRSTFVHDNKLVNGGRKEKIKKVTRKLIDKWGDPYCIHVSPLRRGRQTIRVMKRYLQSWPKGKIWLNPDVSRYFNSKEQKNPDVCPSSLEFDIPIYESVGDFRRRVERFIERMERHGYHKRDGPVLWIVTHALVYKEIAEIYDIKTHSMIDFLEYMKIST